MSKTIFDILVTDSAPETRSMIRSREEEVDLSIRNHLHRLLNSRRGSLTHLPDFGMPDIAALYLELPYTRDKIMSCIRQCVSDFEPRLRHPHVRPVHRDDKRDVTQFDLIGETHQGRRLQYIISLYRNGSVEVAASWEQFIYG